MLGLADSVPPLEFLAPHAVVFRPKTGPRAPGGAMALGRLVLLWCCIVAPTAAASRGAAKPHIVMILADDYGWSNLGAHTSGAPGEDARQARLETHTPNLDALVADGIHLDRHYAYKICSPSRSALQTGRLAVHVNTLNTGVTAQNRSDPVSGYAGIPRNVTGIAQKLRSAGYRTHMVGKWDAGMATPEQTPLGRGYETWVGYFQHANDYWRKGMNLQSTGEIDNCLNEFTDLFMHNATYRGGVRDGVSLSPACKRDPEAHAACYEEHLFKERALEVIREHNATQTDAPLFLFYSFHLLHTPLQVPKAYLDRIDRIVAAGGGKAIDSSNRRLYAAMVLYMDEAVGELVHALKAGGMWDDTLLVFAADNGGPIYEPGAANNHPLKGGKYTDWEGGVRTNAFVSGGFVPKSNRGTNFKGVVSVADWYGTFAGLAGVGAADDAAHAANLWLKQRGLPLLKAVDSVDQWGFILNGTNGRAQPLHLSENAVLMWPFKLVTGKQVYSAWTGPVYPNCSTVGRAASDQGPIFTDLKVFDHHIPPSPSPETTDRLTWAADCGEGCLYDVEADPTEHFDLARDPAHGERLQDMRQRLLRLNQNVFAPGRGTPQLAACDQFVDNGGFYGPFVGAAEWYSPVPPPSAKQRWRDNVTKKLLAAVNRDIVAEGAAAAGRLLLPRVRRMWMRSLDKCLPDADDRMGTVA